MGNGLQCVVIAGLVQLGVGHGLGSIRGTVVDIGGNVVGGVSIEAVPLHGPIVGVVPTTLTDSEGKFELVGVPEGEVQLFTAKEAAGYPSTWASIFLEDENAVPQVIVMDGQIVSDVRVVLPPKCGVLTGVVRDAETNIPIMTARINLHRDDKPLAEYSASIDGLKRFVIALPDVPFTIEVVAPGYRIWSSEHDQERVPTGHIRLSSLDNVHLDLALAPR